MLLPDRITTGRSFDNWRFRSDCATLRARFNASPYDNAPPFEATRPIRQEYAIGRHLRPMLEAFRDLRGIRAQRMR